MMNALEQLKEMTTVVADTGDINAIARYKPQDATTNPSLILKAVNDPRYAHLVDEAVSYGRQTHPASDDQVARALEKVSINFGTEILKIIPGRVSTEVDARLSYNTTAMYNQALRLIDLYDKAGIGRDRVLIKLVSTLEGIHAAQFLREKSINSNMTLVFNYHQAIRCAQEGVQLVSPFVGRITDWHKKDRGVLSIPVEDDPGVHSVRNIYTAFKKYGYQTEIMGASFRSVEQILALAGCDLLTISPNYLEELSRLDIPVERKLKPDHSDLDEAARAEIAADDFYELLGKDRMATEKLAEGIRLFSEDTIKLEEIIRKKLAE